MIQSCHLLDDQSSSDLFWTEVQGWYNPATFSMIEFHQIRSKSKFKDYTILPHSRWSKFTGFVLNRSPRMKQSCHLLDDQSSPDPFWTKFQGWYNPTTFSMTKVTGSLLDICPGMIQSLFILEDQGLRIILEHMSWDYTIPLHSRGLRPPDHFRADAQGWYNPTATSLLPLLRKVFPNNTKLVSKVFKLYPRQRLRQHISVESSSCNIII